MKQITIYDLLPLLKKGWVAMDKDNIWWWHGKKPKRFSIMWMSDYLKYPEVKIGGCFNIAPFYGDWRDSLIKVEHKEEE